MKAELLDAETEFALAYAWRDERDEEALHRLVTAYMRLAISMAAKFKRYGAPMNDLIQEAGLGPDEGRRQVRPRPRRAVLDLRRVVDQGLDPGLRDAQLVDGAHRAPPPPRNRCSSTCAACRPGSSARRLGRWETLDKHQLRQMIATEVGVPLHDVEMMEGRLSGSDYSLNATQSVDDEGREWIDTLEDESAQAAEAVEDKPMTWRTAARVADQRDAGAERARALHRAGAQAARRAPDAGKPRQRAGPVEGARAPAGGRRLRQDAQDARGAVAAEGVVSSGADATFLQIAFAD
jgi:RNA polymerase sigma-32 factor